MLLLGSALAIGSVHVRTLLVVSAFAILGLLALAGQRNLRLGRRSNIFLLLTLYCFFQAAPLPITWVELLSPHHAEVYRNALLPLPGEVTTASLTFDRGATLVEALKWVLYATTLLLATQVARRAGANRIYLMVFGSGVVLASVTLLHGLVNAERVFGFYEPTTKSPHWALSPLINPNNLAGYLNLATFAGLGPFLTQKNRDVQRWMSVGIILTITQSILSGSRGGLITLLIGLALLWITLRRLVLWRADPRLTRRALTWCLATFAGALLAAWLSGPKEVWQDFQDTSLDKLKLTTWTFDIISQFPIFGVGAGAFEAVVPRFNEWGGNTVFTHPENFALGWMSEFGVPMGALLLLSILWVALRNRALTNVPTVSAASVSVGMAIVLLQNLFDLAFTVPGFAVAFWCLVGGLYSSPEGGDQRKVGNNRNSHPSLSVSAPLITLFICAWISTVFLARHTAEDDRRTLYSKLGEVDFSQARDVDDFFETLEMAMFRHPADAYLRRLGATAAHAARFESSLAWASASLALAPAAAQTHLLLAHILIERRVQHQALMELKFAVRQSPDLSREVATTAVSWTTNPSDLARIVPTGTVGTGVLVELARAIGSPEQSFSFIEQALERSPRSVDAHSLLVEKVLEAAQQGRSSCHASTEHCLLRAEQSLEFLERQSGASEGTLRSRANLLKLRGKADEALELLIAHCPSASTGCLRLAITIGQKLDRPLDQLVRNYEALTCLERDGCAQTHLWLASIYTQRREPGTALRHSMEAAKLMDTAKAWFETALVAENLNALTQAAFCIEEAARRSLGPGREQEQIERASQRIQDKLRRPVTNGNQSN